MIELAGKVCAMLGREYIDQDCALARALEVVGERWTLLILRDAFYGVNRFNDFRAHLDIPKAVLAERLSNLVAEGLLERVQDPAHGGRHLYELTASGRDLWPAIHALISWGSNHRELSSRVYKHAECGTILDEDGGCSTCRVVPRPDEILTEPREGREPHNGHARTDPVALALRGPHRLLEPLET
jgi:DNA-binding HxlR family transcriptional regulator